MEALLSLVYEYLLEEPFTCGEFDAGQEMSGEAKTVRLKFPSGSISCPKMAWIWKVLNLSVKTELTA